MDPKFQTSFIPKKSSSPSGGPKGQSSPGGSFFLILSVILFVVSILLAGGAFAWQNILLNSQNTYKQTLSQREQQFDPNSIEQLKEANIQIDTAQQLLSSHLALSQIFKIISDITIENVRFSSLDIAGPTTPGAPVVVTLKGYGSSFSAVAFQSDVLGSLEQYGLRNVVKNPILSDPALADNGTVSFGLTASIDPSALSYEKMVTSTSTTP